MALSWSGNFVWRPWPAGQACDSPSVAGDALSFVARGAFRVGVRLALSACLRLSVRAAWNWPATGPFVLVANHASHLDALVLLAAAPLARVNGLHPVAAVDTFFHSPWRRFLSRTFLGAVPMERDGISARHGVRACRRLLADGESLVYFPEGTRTATGRMGRFKAGIGEIVAGTHVPVIPCHIAGTFEAWPKWRRLPRPAAIALKIGRPMTFAHLTPSREASRAIAVKLEEAVRGLGSAEALAASPAALLSAAV